DLGAIHQRQAIGVDEDAHAVLFEHRIVVAPLMGQVGHVAPARTAGAGHAEAQAQGGGVALQEALHAVQGDGCEGDGHAAGPPRMQDNYRRGRRRPGAWACAPRADARPRRRGPSRAHAAAAATLPLPYGPHARRIQAMTLVSVEHALAGRIPAGGEVTVRGWVRTRRDSKAGLSFVNVSDGSCFAPIQVVAPATLDNYESEVKRLTAGCSVIANGTLVASQGQGQSFEIQATSVEVVGWVEDPETYPIQPKAHSLEFLREVAHLRPRTNLFGAVTRIRHCLAQAAHRYFHENGFYWINTPIITTSDAEGAGQMFRVSTLDMANLPRNDR